MSEVAAQAVRPSKAPLPARPIVPAATRPTFAIIITAYQGADVVGEAIGSALAQTLPADQVVVCDDGSTDDFERAIEPFRDRLVIVRKENGGTSSALNAAVAVSSADFVVQLDQDDLYLPERLEAIAELAAARPDLDIITTDIFLEVGGQIHGRYGDFHRFPVDAAGQRDEILRHCFFAVPAIRRERLLAIGGFDESLQRAVDWDCWMRLILDGALVGLVDEPLYRYRLSTTSISGNPARSRRANVAVLEKALGYPGLSSEERGVVEEGIRNYTRRAALYEAKEAVLEGRPDARRRSLGVLTGSGQPLASRLKAAGSAIAPGVARQLMERQIARSLTGGIELEHR